MKLVPMILSAAMLAGSCTLAMAQTGGGGAGGGAGSDVNPHRVGRGTDANPSAINANPRLGNSAATPRQRGLSRRDNARWDGQYRNRRYSGSYGWNRYDNNGGWNRGWNNGGWNSGWSNAPVGLYNNTFGAGPYGCSEDLGYGRYESCGW